MKDDQLEFFFVDSEFDAVLQRLDRSIKRMRQKGFDPSPLIEKRNIWLSGEGVIRDVQAESIAVVGQLFPKINKNTKGKRIVKKQRLIDPGELADRFVRELYQGA